MSPNISILMSCFNSEKTVSEAIESILSQSYRDWELLVIDDASSDRSVEIINGFSDKRIHLLQQENQGWPAARNYGLKHAKGEFLAFLDSDDTWHPEFLTRMIDAISDNPAAILAYCGWQNVGLQGGRGEPFIPPEYDAADRAEVFLGGCRWPIHGVVIQTSVVRDAGGFDETFRASADYDLWLRVATKGRLILVPEVLAFYRHHDGEQITKNKRRSALHHHRAQVKFIRENPRAARRLGTSRVRTLLYGELLRRAYACYWDRDLASARTLFRRVMRRGYGNPKDWLYMLPSLLPIQVHGWLLDKRDRHS